MTYYTIKPGDTLSEIASKFDTTIGVLQNFNYIPNPDRIEVGDVLQIPNDYPTTDTGFAKSLRELFEAIEKLPEYIKCVEFYERINRNEKV